MGVMESVNINDIAQLAGVSISTVSRVLNNHPDVSEKTRSKVMLVMEEHSYIPNDSARNLKRESVRAVGVIVKGFSNPFFTSMLAVIQNKLESADYLMLLRQVDPQENEIDAAIALTKEKKPRGLIFLGGNFEQRREKLSLLEIPFVMATISLRKGVDRAQFSSVCVDDYAEGYRLMERILLAGHRRVAVIGHREDDRSVSRLRIEGFLQAARDKRVAMEDISVAYAGEFTLAAGYAIAKEQLGRARFTCVFCISDVLALGAMRALHEAGYRIPDDISVVGFDGIDSGRYAIPSLTTVRQPADEMASHSVRILLQRLRRGKAHEHRVFPAEFLERESFRSITSGD